MKTSNKFLKWFMVGSSLALCLMIGATASAQTQTNKLRIGVYDSRAVAAAYANSTEFQETLKAVRADYEQAKAAKDDKRLKQLDSRMKLQQRQLHEQVFSTASVSSILAKLKGALPAVSKKTRVQAIVSKWELSHQEPEVELVDVTEDLAVLFHTNDTEQKWRGILKHPPVPIEEITE